MTLLRQFGLLLAALLWQTGAPSTDATAVFAGGCFWGVEAVFEHVRGVRSVASGYADEGIEAVRIVYAPDQVSYEDLLSVFFRVAHDPTQRDHQGPDVGPEYRAVVYYRTAEQHQRVTTYIAELERSRRFPGPIVTEVRALGTFRVAETFHQDYAARHPDDPYIVVNDAPKMLLLRRAFPALYRESAGPEPHPAP